jgi:peptidoglycan/LPS O-acetylase OafA/YrhL
MAMMAFLTFILRTLQAGHKWPQIWHSLYSCLEKPFFILGLMMVTFPTVLGVKGSFFRTVLDNKILSFLAKISFCTYLVHLMVIMQYISSRTFDNYYSLLATITPFLGCLVVSCFFGFLMTIFVELPFSVWQKEVMKGLMNRTKSREGTSEKSEELIGVKINQTI